MADEKKEKWYFKDSAMIVIFLVAGPFVLPLVWFNPRLNIKMKAVVTIAILILSYALWMMMQASIKSVGEYYKEILS
ncbi:MAG: hypothetical protein AUJ74_02335 [Candidatus Omnitrophica bacterium CG1_02_44_16]|nr:MAG: hypothetical protein AUJ74_02335 [Candidatus Omnitrophica bacterium CG1_02_44_16]PIY82546.1 MAG: hypothetical protein COY78_06860 [Candidatus Omnitrophica bacterium CG_4_10_14_0_8_um_filter_44_12]PIZ84732.1 MAG: hypothetical protein COX96_02355 [Candidatus Omnitrophica bacterium CG_4_10_14_0_2_um_filter_44_9]